MTVPLMAVSYGSRDIYGRRHFIVGSFLMETMKDGVCAGSGS